jgi:DNA-binding HxlR family transcriptional regulator
MLYPMSHRRTATQPSDSDGTDRRTASRARRPQAREAREESRHPARTAVADAADYSTDPANAPIDWRECSIAAALDALGDTWSILVLRELFFNRRRFNDMQRDLGISRSVLAERLNRLNGLGLIKSEPYQEPGDRVRKQYRLTRKGVGLLHTVIALMEFGNDHLGVEVGLVTLHDRQTGDPVRLELRSSSGRLVAPNEIETRLHPRRRGTQAS